jgi:hypothetical protein
MKKNYMENFSFIENRAIVDVTIVLNIWKRNHISEQLNSLLTQTVLPSEIWVIHYEKNVEIDHIIEFYRKYFQKIIVIKSDKNLKYFGRFSIAINISTKFSWLIDDDVIPGEKWLENCTNKCESLNSIICSTGRLIPKDNYQPERNHAPDRQKYFVGDINFLFKNFCEKDTLVDYGCNSYFFKSEWIKSYWSIWPATFLTGEDIHLSATCKCVLGISTYVIEQNDMASCGNTKKAYGNDETATWKTSDFISLREEVLRYHINTKNWKPLLW